MPNAKSAPRSQRPPAQQTGQRTAVNHPIAGNDQNNQQGKRQTNGSQHQGGNSPIAKVSCFPVEAAIWLNYSQDYKPMYSVTFQRVYKANDGAWKRTQGYAGSDLLILSQVAQGAWNRIRQLKDEDRNNSQPNGPHEAYQAGDEDVPF